MKTIEVSAQQEPPAESKDKKSITPEALWSEIQDLRQRLDDEIAKGSARDQILNEHTTRLNTAELFRLRLRESMKWVMAQIEGPLRRQP